MFVIAEGFLQHIEDKAIREALSVNVAPKSFRRYVDDSHARFDKHGQAESFLENINAQEPNIQYTIKWEDHNKTLPFLDILIENNKTGNYDFKIHCKSAITNVQIKKTSCLDPKITQGVFKGFLSRAWNICTEKY